MRPLIWRVYPLAPPPWRQPCPRCPQTELLSTGKFRVNANAARHDVWLIYRCARCDARRNRRILRRVPEDRGGARLEPYRRNDAALALQHAFAMSASVRLPYAVERPPLPDAGELRVRIEQPFSCGVRWDRFLARELHWARSRVAAALRDGVVSISPPTRGNRVVRDGEILFLRLSDQKRAGC